MSAVPIFGTFATFGPTGPVLMRAGGTCRRHTSCIGLRASHMHALVAVGRAQNFENPWTSAWLLLRLSDLFLHRSVHGLLRGLFARGPVRVGACSGAFAFVSISMSVLVLLCGSFLSAMGLVVALVQTAARQREHVDGIDIFFTARQLKRAKHPRSWLPGCSGRKSVRG